MYTWGSTFFLRNKSSYREENNYEIVKYGLSHNGKN